MKQYINSSGKSGVVSYESGENHIVITFQGNETYIYNEIKPGKVKVEKMKQLAAEGLGLSTFISQQVKGNFYKKL